MTDDVAQFREVLMPRVQARETWCAAITSYGLTDRGQGEGPRHATCWICCRTPNSTLERRAPGTSAPKGSGV